MPSRKIPLFFHFKALHLSLVSPRAQIISSSDRRQVQKNDNTSIDQMEDEKFSAIPVWS